MIETGGASLAHRWAEWELACCGWANRVCRRGQIRVFFSIVSRLGDGVLWYMLMALLPLIYGMSALEVSMRMGLASLVGVIIYKIVKALTERPRPYTQRDDIQLGAAPLDRYSFPSGHTLHAISFSLIAIHFYPELAWLLAPFAALVAVSRVVLGLHYPTDVLAGAGIGMMLGLVAIYL